MSLTKILELAGGALNAQTVRLNTIASNLANAETVSGSPTEAYKAKRPVFETIMSETKAGLVSSYGVKVNSITELSRVNPQVFAPDNPMADKDGYVYRANVNPLEEMTDMLEASRAYETSLSTATTARELMMRTIDMSTK
jgi:flagellar basal-body rod protein FlgC